MIEVSSLKLVQGPWLSVPVISIGPGSFKPSLAEVFVTVSVDGQPRLRIDVYAAQEPECYAFQETLAWHGVVVIGFGERLHLIDLESGVVTSIILGAYFGHLYPTEDYLLAASAERLFCIDPKGNVVWTTEPLGIDGVLVNEIRENVICGEGEWDPPGGWISYRVRLTDGMVI